MHPFLETLDAPRFGRGGEERVAMDSPRIVAVPVLPNIRKLALSEGWIAGILASYGNGELPAIEELRSSFSLGGPFLGPTSLLKRLPHLRRIHGDLALTRGLPVLAQHSPNVRWIQAQVPHWRVFGGLQDLEWRPSHRYPATFDQWVSVWKSPLCDDRH